MNLNKPYLQLCALAFLLAGCSSVYFAEPMPRNGNIQHSFPDFLEGTFIHVSFESNAVKCSYRHFERINDGHIYMTNYDADYLDSAAMIQQGLSIIDTAYFQDQHIYVQDGKSRIKLELADSLKRYNLAIPVEINIREGYYLENDTTTCEFLSFKGRHFLSINDHTLSGHYSMEIMPIPNGMSVRSSEWLLMSDSAFRMLPFSDKIVALDNEKSNRSDYIANITDAQFLMLMDTPGVFYTMTWNRVKPPIPWLSIGLLSLAIVLFGWIFKIYKRSKM